MMEENSGMLNFATDVYALGMVRNQATLRLGPHVYRFSFVYC